MAFLNLRNNMVHYFYQMGTAEPHEQVELVHAYANATQAPRVSLHQAGVDLIMGTLHGSKAPPVVPANTAAPAGHFWGTHWWPKCALRMFLSRGTQSLASKSAPKVFPQVFHLT